MPSEKKTLKHPKRFLQRLKLPEEAPKVLLTSGCWTEEFCRLYFERCDEVLFESPSEGLEMAEIAPLLAKRVSVEACGSHQRQKELLIQALAILGGAQRATGHPSLAHRSYETALEICREGEVAETEKANLYRRLAVLRSSQKRFAEALTRVGSAIEIYRRFPDRRDDLASTLVIRGVVHSQAERPSEAIRDFCEALTLADPKGASHTYQSAVHNLALNLLRTSSVESLGEAQRLLRRARRLLVGRRRCSLPKQKLNWLEGLILVRLGLTRRGEVLLRQARQGFVELGAPFEMALVSLDLARLYCDEGAMEDLLAVATETFDRFHALCPDPEARNALVLWRRAIARRALTDKILRKVREILCRRCWRRGG